MHRRAAGRCHACARRLSAALAVLCTACALQRAATSALEASCDSGLLPKPQVDISALSAQACAEKTRA